MDVKATGDQTILVTGGTSGLGLELVKILLSRGFSVVATGRRKIDIAGSGDNFTLYLADFNDLASVADIAGKILNNHRITSIVNNAGILSPLSFIPTRDGLESAFQINFLSHLLIDELILSDNTEGRKIRIASVSSPVYRLAAARKGIQAVAAGYNPLRSYASSKLYLALIHEFLSAHDHQPSPEYFSFNPGTFSSGIYRMQKQWFWSLYRIAAPFMRSPASVARVLADLLADGTDVDGFMFDFRGRRSSLPDMEDSEKEELKNYCFAIIGKFLK